MKKKTNKSLPDLEIIIVTHNSEYWLKKCLDSLQENYLNQTKNKVTVTVVDNASTDQTAQVVAKMYPWANYLSTKENLGFAAGNNLAIKQSRARYVMLLNSDTQLTEESRLDELIKYLDKHKETAVISPRLELVDGSIDPASHRGEPTPWASLTYFSGLENLLPDRPLFAQYHQLYKSLNQIHNIDACSGAAMLVRATAIDKVGLLDERFFMYAEDLDWCRRFRLSGYNIIYYPEVKIIHHKYKSGLKSSSQNLARQTRKHFYNTMLQYYDKHYRDQYPAIVRWCLQVFITIKKGAL